MGYIDRSGNWVIEPRFLMAEQFSGGVARVQDETGFGLIDASGAFIWGPTPLQTGPGIG